MFAPRSEPLALPPWQVMHSAAQIFFPRSAAAASTICLSSDPAPPPTLLGGCAGRCPPAPRPGGVWALRQSAIAVASRAACIQTLAILRIYVSPLTMLEIVDGA